MSTQTMGMAKAHKLPLSAAPVIGALLILGLWGFSSSDPVTLTVRMDRPGPRIDPIFYGLMTEEINYSYDGGLYGELIRNRIFQDRPIPQGRGTRGGTANPAGSQSAAQTATQNPPPAQVPAAQPPAANPAVATHPNLINWWLVTSNGATGDIDIDAKDPVNTIAPGQRSSSANGRPINRAAVRQGTWPSHWATPPGSPVWNATPTSSS